MRKIAVIGMTLFIAALAFAAPASAAWLKAETPNFVVHADTDRASIEKTALELEMLEAALRGMAGVAAPRTGAKLNLYLLGDVSDIRKMVDMPANAGAFFSSGDGEAIAVAAFADKRSRVAYDWRWPLFHEYAHYFMRRHLSRIQPAWHIEGFASLFETATFPDATTVNIGAAPPSRNWLLTERQTVPTRDIMRLGLEEIREEFHDYLYAQGWLISHYYHVGRSRPDEFGKYLTAVAARRAMPDLDSFFVGGVDGLGKDLQAYAAKAPLPVVSLTVAPVPPSAISVLPMRPADIAMTELRIREAGVDGFSMADALLADIKTVADKFPEELGVREFQARLAYEARNYAASEAIVDGLSKSGAASPRVRTLKGLAIMRHALDDAPPAQFDKLLAQSRTLISTALKDAPDDPFILRAMFATYEADVDDVPPVGFDYLRRAIALVPDDSYLRLDLAEQLGRVGDPRAAAEALDPVANGPHRTSVARRAAAARNCYLDAVRSSTGRSGICVER